MQVAKKASTVPESSVTEKIHDDVERAVSAYGGGNFTYRSFGSFSIGPRTSAIAEPEPIEEPEPVEFTPPEPAQGTRKPVILAADGLEFELPDPEDEPPLPEMVLDEPVIEPAAAAPPAPPPPQPPPAGPGLEPAFGPLPAVSAPPAQPPLGTWAAPPKPPPARPPQHQPPPLPVLASARDPHGGPSRFAVGAPAPVLFVPGYAAVRPAPEPRHAPPPADPQPARADEAPRFQLAWNTNPSPADGRDRAGPQPAAKDAPLPGDEDLFRRI